MKLEFLFAPVALAASLALASCAGTRNMPTDAGGALVIARQGVFASGGTVTEPVPGRYDETKNWLDPKRPGNTAHVDHANVLYQIPAGPTKSPVLYLHGYGQSRMGWMTTPDGREGFSDIFLKKGRAAFLVDQPRRGEAGATVRMASAGGIDAWGEDGKLYKPGDQAWYTHFRIGRVAPGRYEGSQFPPGDAAQNQFFRQMTPNTGDYDEKLFGAALSAALADARRIAGKKLVYMTHSQGGRVGWQTDADDIAAIVAIEPGYAPKIGSPEYEKFLAAKIPMVFYFGDYIENGPADIESTKFWKGVLDQCREFAARYTADGGDAAVVHLPDLGIRGNSHFLFQELNNRAIADHIEAWLEARGL